MADTHGSDEEDLGFIAVANGPSNEVGVRLTTESSFSDLDGWEESRGMSRVLESVKTRSTILMGEIEFSRRCEGEVMSHYAVDLITHRLDSDCYC